MAGLCVARWREPRVSTGRRGSRIRSRPEGAPSGWQFFRQTFKGVASDFPPEER